MKKPLQITVGSENSQKIEAVRLACKELGIKATISGVSAKSGQGAQPVGFQQTLDGALARADYAKRENRKALAVGIENGIFRFGRHPAMTLDMAIIVIVIPDDRHIVTTSPAVPFPERAVTVAERLGFDTTTVGTVIAQLFGGEHNDPHAALSDGKVTRQMTLVHGLIIALRQL